MAAIFRRPELAAQMASQLLHPGVLDEGLRSGLFLSGLRRTGKTTFLRNDLIPALEQQGALVIYVDLWSDTKASPGALVRGAVRQALAELQSPVSSLLRAKLASLRQVDVAAMGFTFGFQLETLGREGGATMAQAFAEVVDQAKADLVLIIDEVQQAVTSDDGNQMLLALKAARDAVNLQPHMPGSFLFIGTGSHRAQVSELTARRNQAFAGATSLPYPALGRDYVEHVLQRLGEAGIRPLPSLDGAVACFETLGNRPEELGQALRQMHANASSGVEPDTLLSVIASTLRSKAVDIELSKVERIGSLAMAVFSRVARADSLARGLFSAEAAAEYAKAVGREVRTDEIQSVVNELLADNILMRPSHGRYDVTDPYVKEIWREREAFPPEI
ncbi:MAG: ATP-binding protein [Synechococcus sp. SB0668_bin_15]|nr:ATP-binding protein [Synechococcus sp. SB0668_bin_15]MYC49605.1 ATP-binding protein [Synechococcus sp. SB0662_bin_14]